MRIACVIPHYGSDALLERCMSGIDRDEVRVEVVDNNARNRLFTRGVNVGIRRVLANASGPAPSAIWILNNDCIPQPGCAENALACLAVEERCGIVGCQNRLLSDPDRIVWGGSGAWYPVGTHKTGLASAGHLQARTDEVWATFASVFVSVALIREIGLLDENLLHIGSDADYCLRARLAGWRVLHEPTAVVHHEMGSSSRCENGVLRDVMRKDGEYLESKWVKGLFRGIANVDA